MNIEYKLHKSDKDKYHAGNYQILEFVDDQCRTCGIYFNKKDALKDLKRLTKEI